VAVSGRARRLGWRAAGTAVAVAGRLPPRPLPPGPGHRMVFVAGCPRSGTTWVSLMLQHHDEVVGTSESHALAATDPVRRHGAASPSAWAALFRRADTSPAYGLLAYVDRATLLRLAVAAARAAATGTEAADLLVSAVFDHYVRARPGGAGRVLVEKTPAHLLRARHLLGLFPSARMIEVVRDGRDVCASMAALAPQARWVRRDRVEQIRTWVSYLEEGERLGADPAIAPRLLRVRYEDLRSDPAAGLTGLLGFAGLAAGEARLRQILDATDLDRHGAGALGRGRGRVGGWRDHLDGEEAALFWELAGPVATRAGYRP